MKSFLRTSFQYYLRRQMHHWHNFFLFFWSYRPLLFHGQLVHGLYLKQQSLQEWACMFVVCSLCNEAVNCSPFQSPLGCMLPQPFIQALPRLTNACLATCTKDLVNNPFITFNIPMGIFHSAGLIFSFFCTCKRAQCSQFTGGSEHIRIASTVSRISLLCPCLFLFCSIHSNCKLATRPRCHSCKSPMGTQDIFPVFFYL